LLDLTLIKFNKIKNSFYKYKFCDKLESFWHEMALLYVHKEATAVRMVATKHNSMKYSNLPTHHFFQPIAVEILERLVYCL